MGGVKDDKMSAAGGCAFARHARACNTNVRAGAREANVVRQRREGGGEL